MRELRKKEHVENYLRSMYEGDTLLSDVFLPNNSLPELNFDELDISMEFLGKKIDCPIMINAMTGGSEFTKSINNDLARLARQFNIPMAVGSQTIALCEDNSCIESFSVVRDIIGEEGVVISNLSASASLEDCQRAVELLNSDAIQLHLNPGQEMVMREGDRDFRGILDNIKKINENIDKPLIVKEVGLGMSKEVVTKLENIGVKYIDISGAGGTNFIEIENLRNADTDLSELFEWGVPTALSIIEARKVSSQLNIIGSGGIRSSLDIVKAIVLGADIVGIAGELMSYLQHGGYETAEAYLEDTVYKIKVIMMLLGKANIKELKETKYKVKGTLKELLEG